HEDERRELVAGTQLELRLISAGETVMTAVRAAAERVQRPVERHSLDGIQRRSERHLLVPRIVRPALRLIERVRSVFAVLQRDYPGGGAGRAEIEKRRGVHGSFAFTSP